MDQYADSLRFDWLAQHGEKRDVDEVIRALRGETRSPSAPQQDPQEIDDNWRRMAKAFKGKK